MVLFETKVVETYRVTQRYYLVSINVGLGDEVELQHHTVVSNKHGFRNG